MITVHVYKEIREYKEKVIAGLTWRNIIFGGLALLIAVPTFIYLTPIFGEDIASWIILILCGPLVAVGFGSKNGMPFEKYICAVAKRFLTPSKLYYKEDNFIRHYQTLSDKEKSKYENSSKMLRYRKQASLERAYLIEEALEKQEVEIGKPINIRDVDNKMITIKKPKNPEDTVKEKQEKKQKKKKDKVKKSKAQIVYENVEKKKKDNAFYVPTRKEGFYLKKYFNELKKKELNDRKKKVKEVSQKNTQMKKSRKNVKTFIPKSTQDMCPYITDYDEGLIEVEENTYSKCYELVDINYSIAEEKETIGIFAKWADFMNYFSDDMLVTVCIDNRIISTNEKENKIFCKMYDNNLDLHRKEYNKVLKNQMMIGNNDMQLSKFVVVTIKADSPYEALVRFRKIDSDVITNLRKIGSSGRVCDSEERLALLHDKFRKGREGEFAIDYDFLKEQGLSSKDYIAPSHFDFSKKDYFTIGDNLYGKCMYITNLPRSLSDELMQDIMGCKFPLDFTVSIQPIEQGVAAKMVMKQLTSMEGNLIEAQRKAVKAGYSEQIVNHELQQSVEEGVEFFDAITSKNQKVFYVSLMLMLTAETKEELNDNVKSIDGIVRKYTCQLNTYDNQQADAFKAILPMGIPPKGKTCKLYTERTLTTESTAVFIPFSSQELYQIGGIYYGLNQLTKNMIMCDRTKMKTPSGFVLGSSGSGKSFACKREMLAVLLKNEQNGLLIIDPENEYGSGFAQMFGGTVIVLSSSSKTYVNPMDMDENYGLDENDDPTILSLSKKKEKALKKKTEYLMSIIAFMYSDEEGNSLILPQHKTTISKAIKRTYKDFLEHDFDYDYIPTMCDLQDELDKEAEMDEDLSIKQLAKSVEYYTRETMDLFSHKSNVDYNNRFVVFNIKDLDGELRQIGLLIVMDFIWNRMTKNNQKKIRTYCYIDEIHVLFQNAFAERYINQLYKRGRKYGLVITGITQDVSDLLRSDVAQAMIQNSDFVYMLNQKGKNLEKLSEMLKLSESQQEYLTNALPGAGLLYAEKVVIPFIDDFPKTSYLYAMMNTQFDEENVISKEEAEKYVDSLQKKYIGSSYMEEKSAS